MMKPYTLGVIREFHTKNFVVKVTAEEELDLDLSWDEDGSVAEGLMNGKYVAFCAKAAVYFKGEEIASDYLGGCVYKDFEDFMDHRACGKQNKEYAAKGEAGRCGSYFHDMIRVVCQQARLEIEAKREAYNHIKVRS